MHCFGDGLGENRYIRSTRMRGGRATEALCNYILVS